MSKWNAEEVKLLENIYPFFGNKKTTHIFDKLGIDKSSSAIGHKTTDLDIKFVGGGVDGFLDQADEEIIEKVRPYLSDVEGTKQEIIISKNKIINTACTMMRELHDILEETKPRPKIKLSSDKNAASLIVQLSDLHAGAREKDQKGRVIYSTEMMVEQMSKFSDKIQRIAEIHSKGDGKVDEFVIAIVGDVVDGTMIYDGHLGQVDEYLLGQYKTASKCIWEMIVTLKKNFGYPIRIFTVPGNHGSTIKGMLEANIDNFVYTFVQGLIEESKIENVEIDISQTDYNDFEVRGHGFTMVHKGVTQVATASGRARASAYLKNGKASVLLCGHFHQAGWSQFGEDHVFSNGTMKTSDNFARTIARPQSYGIQNIFGVTEHRVPTFIYPIQIKK